MIGAIVSEDEPQIDAALVKQLLAAQCPHWSHLPITPVSPGGWCNRAFHLGDEMIVRLPRHHAYAAQIEKEFRWLPQLAQHLPLPIPEPMALGLPGNGYPWHWSVYRWLPGQTAQPENIAELTTFATELGRFLAALHVPVPPNGPPPGAHNFYRGGGLAVYDQEFRHAMALLGGRIDTAACMAVWESALANAFTGTPVWIHGDISAGNLLVCNGRLCAVIDFGNLCVGDPACDLAMAWTMFAGESRAAFRVALPVDAGTWARGRAWVLWKAMIIASGLSASNALEAAQPWRIIAEVLADHRHAQAR